jgi:filamentous hemagglutinin family protein
MKAFIAVLLLCAPFSAGAMPVGADVVSGSASFSLDGSTLEISATPGTVIDWSSFSIASGETVRFVGGSSDAVVNQVIGGAPLTISGTLLANGGVALVSPTGVALDGQSVVQAGNLLLSTYQLVGIDFSTGSFALQSNPAAGSIALAGALATSNSLVLAGSSVGLDGSVSATGAVQLVSGNFGGPTATRAGVAYQPLQPGGTLSLLSGHFEAGDANLTLGGGTLTLVSSSGSGSVGLSSGTPATITLSGGDSGAGLMLMNGPAPVPLPGALALLLGGLATLGGFAAQRKR